MKPKEIPNHTLSYNYTQKKVAMTKNEIEIYNAICLKLPDVGMLVGIHYSDGAVETRGWWLNFVTYSGWVHDHKYYLGKNKATALSVASQVSLFSYTCVVMADGRQLDESDYENQVEAGLIK